MAKNNNFFKKLVPFTFLTVGAFYGMYEFRKLDYQFPKGKAYIYREDLKRFGIEEKDYQAKTAISIEEEYEKMMKTMDINNWENVRGPRPYEDNTEFYEKMSKKIEERKQEKKSKS